jgi:hypothetical protein
LMMSVKTFCSSNSLNVRRGSTAFKFVSTSTSFGAASLSRSQMRCVGVGCRRSGLSDTCSNRWSNNGRAVAPPTALSIYSVPQPSTEV